MAPLGEVRILVVEDDAAIRQLIVWMLEDRGYLVVTASNGREAIEQAKTWCPELVILDMGLPYLDGVRVSTFIHNSDGSAPRIIVVSADNQAATKARAIHATALITKPFDVDELLDTVDRVLTGEPHVGTDGLSSAEIGVPIAEQESGRTVLHS